MAKEKKIAFISHAVADAPVVKAFVTLLESGIGVPPGNIFCTSLKGQGIKPGAEFKKSIHDRLGEASTVIALISENFYNSAFCMCELGGVWLQSKDFIPILIPPTQFSDMKAVLQGLQALKIELSDDLDELRDEITERLEIDPLPTPRWNGKREEFLKILPNLMKDLPQSPVVPRAKMEKYEKLSAEFEGELKNANAEIVLLKKMNAKLLSVKDAKSVKSILKAGLSSVETFESLASDLYQEFGQLEKITREVIFHDYIGDFLNLNNNSSGFDWSDAKSPLQYKEILMNDMENGVVPNESNKKVNSAIKSLTKIGKWLESQGADEDFLAWYASEYDGLSPDISDRSFWDHHIW